MLALVDDFRTANWPEIIKYLELVYQKSQHTFSFMHRIKYFFIAVIFLFAGIYIGLFAATWHYLDHPVVEEVEKQPVNVENNYYIKYYQHLESEQTLTPPLFLRIQKRQDLSRLRDKFLETGS